jgi:glutathione S-transferase
MKLYDSRRAPNPRRVRWFLAEKGIDDIEIVDVDLFAGAHKTPEYIGKAGVAQVPVLELDDGLAVSESIAICRYLESRYPEPNLFGRTPEEIAVIEQWMRRAEMYLATPLMMAVRHGHPALAALETQSPEYAEYSRADALKALKMFERQLAAYPFLAGDRFTIADIVAYVGLDFARMVKFVVPDEFPHVQKWAAEMKTRPAASAGV